MDEEQTVSGPVRVGMRWGGLGGVAGFLASLVLSLLGGIVAAVFVGVACGRRAAAADEGDRRGGRSGLVSALVAAPVFVLGAAAGALVTLQGAGLDELSSTATEVSGVELTSQEMWLAVLLALVFAATVQVAVLVASSMFAAARAAGRSEE